MGEHPTGKTASAPSDDASGGLQTQLAACYDALREHEDALQRARQQHAESEARFAMLADAAPVMIWMTGADSECVFVNQAWQRFTGRSADEERGGNWTQNLHPDDTARCIAAHTAAFEARTPFSIEYRLRRVDGVYRWLLDSAQPRYDGKGRFLGFVGCCVDITERREAEDGLRLKARYQRALLDNFPFLVWLKDTESRFLAVNAAFTQAFDIASPDDLINGTDFDIVPPALAESYRAGDRKVLRDGHQLSIEEEIPYHGGRRWFETYKAPVFDDDGRIVGTVGFARDVTERKDAEGALLRLKDTLEEQVALRTAEAEARARALWESERFSRATIDALPCALCVLDGSGVIVAVNKSWRALVITNGGDIETMCEGASYLAACQPATRMNDAALTNATMAVRGILTGELDSYAFEYEGLLGEDRRWFSFEVSPFPDHGPVRLLVKHDDMTERRHLQEEQVETAARFKRLAAHLDMVREEQSTKIAREVHDELGSTLTMLKLGLATVADDETTPPRIRNKFAGMLEQIDAALQTVKRISTSLRPATLDTLGLIATISWYARQFSSMTGIDVALQMPEYVRLTPAANTAVFRIIQEGLTNVAKHAGANRVDLTLQKQSGQLVVRISDNGVGLTSDSLSKRNSFGVIGMHERAQHLGGRLTLSGAPQTGTRLTLTIPLDAGAAHSPEKTPSW
ncbi:PAS domain-containing protein [Azoarcus olearius]|uniref:Sensory box histidine kinase n=1 Tax=Azoarcus sp. (strain BH72) TaxID=418699 RepID=A1K959_AZOSB|nr:PAS domain-containing protein [Azoarcus olearius]CAL95364.1 putative sensory box histidine kinase [Azoarcus olearius]